MIADIKEETGMIVLSSENDFEAKLLKKFVVENAVSHKDFTDCCNNKKCEFHIELKENGNG